MSRAVPEARFGERAPFGIGIEEELIAVDPSTHALVHTGVEAIARVRVDDDAGTVQPDTYSALIEIASPVCANAVEGARSLDALRAAIRDAGAVVIGAGIHPDAAFGDVEHVDAERYKIVIDLVRGLIGRTPTGATHVHVGMPDAETAIHAFNGLREHLPVLQAAAANSPFWGGTDSGLASTRASLFRSFPSSEIPRAFEGYDDYLEAVDATAAAGGVRDYTFLWWDVRPSPRLGTVEVRAMDSQSALWSTVGLAALIHALARREAELARPAASLLPREVLMEASFNASRDGLDARVPWDGGSVPAREALAGTIALARPYARELGAEGALDELQRTLDDGNGADRQRAAFGRGGIPALLAHLVAETAAPYG